MKILRMLVLALVILAGCKEEVDDFDEVAQFAIDLEKIDAYITENNITDTLHHRTKIRYKINTAGTGLQARIGDKIKVEYTGRLMETGEIFDEGTIETILNSGNVILGWYFMCQDMKEEDDWTIYVPSAYCYGHEGRAPTIPADAILIFDMKMLRVTE